jgi:rhodanese-related sulfurtransferase
MLTFNALTNSFYDIEISPSTEGRKLIPTSIEAFEEMDYEVLCSSHSDEPVEEISMQQLGDLQQHEDVTLIDVRELNEGPSIQTEHVRIPLRLLRDELPPISTDTIVAFCHMGIRSIEAVKILREALGSSKKIYSLEGGILSWQKHLYKKQQHV